MERISVFDMIKVGIGPSSSHTMGPWRAALRALDVARGTGGLASVVGVDVTLYGSLAKTGLGHGTQIAVALGLTGEDFLETDTATVPARGRALREAGALPLAGGPAVAFALREVPEPLPFHPNGLRFRFTRADGSATEATYYSVGGGFVVAEDEAADAVPPCLPCPTDTADDLLRHCARERASIAAVVRANERAWRADAEVDAGLDALAAAMRTAVWRGCHAAGTLPGGLGVKRRAAEMAARLAGPDAPPDEAGWYAAIRAGQPSFPVVLKWVSAFALAANEENAAFGRIVTAPTNGACGVLPAVLLYYDLFAGHDAPEHARDFLLVAGELGSLFKKGATISAALGGCQAEVGVSSAMAAAALAEGLGGTPAQALMAAEIAMEHHLGLTCDPIGGLVQVPCIERNAVGAVKAITAAHLALEGDPAAAKVPLDVCIRSMWETALDMHHKYKETAEGGLAFQIPVNVTEC